MTSTRRTSSTVGARAVLQAAGSTSDKDGAAPKAQISATQRRDMQSRKAKDRPDPNEVDDSDDSNFQPDEEKESQQPQQNPKTRSHSNSRASISTTLQAENNTFPCTFTRSCTCTYQTRTGLRKHINAAHTHAVSYACPYPGCDFARPAKETVIRHLQGKHSMPELPLKKTGEDWAKVEREQIRVFKQHVGEDVDVSFFLTLGTAEDGEGEEVADEQHEEVDEGLFVADDEEEAEQSEDSDIPLANRTRSAMNRKPIAAGPITPSTPPPEDVDKFNHTSELHISLLRYSAALSMDSMTLNWPKLWDLLIPEGTDRDEFKRLCETSNLVGRFGEKRVAGVVSREMEYWLMRYPFVEVSLSEWLGERLEEM